MDEFTATEFKCRCRSREFRHVIVAGEVWKTECAQCGLQFEYTPTEQQIMRAAKEVLLCRETNTWREYVKQIFVVCLTDVDTTCQPD